MPLSSFGNFLKNVATYNECFTLMIYNLFEIVQEKLRFKILP